VPPSCIDGGEYGDVRVRVLTELVVDQDCSSGAAEAERRRIDVASDPLDRAGVTVSCARLSTVSKNNVVRTASGIERAAPHARRAA
jgi:hypothetical protein